MRRELPGGYQLDDDRARIDVDVVHAFLSGESYWAAGRPREVVEALLAGAARVVGLYQGEELVGFCRVGSDGVTYAFLFDVFVLPAHRGRGLGVELLREAIERGPHRELPWHLATRDAHELYERFGFGPPDAERQMYRPRPSAKQDPRRSEDLTDKDP